MLRITQGRSVQMVSRCDEVSCTRSHAELEERAHVLRLSSAHDLLNVRVVRLRMAAVGSAPTSTGTEGASARRRDRNNLSPAGRHGRRRPPADACVSLLQPDRRCASLAPLPAPPLAGMCRAGHSLPSADCASGGNIAGKARRTSWYPTGLPRSASRSIRSVLFNTLSIGSSTDRGAGRGPAAAPRPRARRSPPRCAAELDDAPQARSAARELV